MFGLIKKSVYLNKEVLFLVIDIMVLSLKNYNSAAFKVYSGILIRPILFLDTKKTVIHGEHRNKFYLVVRFTVNLTEPLDAEPPGTGEQGGQVDFFYAHLPLVHVAQQGLQIFTGDILKYGEVTL